MGEGRRVQEAQGGAFELEDAGVGTTGDGGDAFRRAGMRIETTSPAVARHGLRHPSLVALRKPTGLLDHLLRENDISGSADNPAPQCGEQNILEGDVRQLAQTLEGARTGRHLPATSAS